MRTCAVMQPTYLPWLGYFDLIARSDIFVIYDTVQFEKQSWQQRNRVRNKDGEIMLTLPVRYGSGLSRRIKEVEIDYSRNVPKKHSSTIQLSYSKARNFSTLFPELEALYKTQPSLLMDLNVALIKIGMKFLNIETPLIYASELDVQGNRVEALIDICKKLNASRYYSPVGSKVYIDENNLFPGNGIELVYQDYSHPVYQQVNFPDFISHLSFIDYLFNVEKHESSGQVA
jgi:hypothetical protein